MKKRLPKKCEDCGRELYRRTSCTGCKKKICGRCIHVRGMCVRCYCRG